MQFNPHRKIIHVDGGLGRVICAEPALRQLAQKSAEVHVITNWPDVFTGAEYLAGVYEVGRPYFYEDIAQWGDFRMPEPYHSYHYYTQRDHLIQSFERLLLEEESRAVELAVPNLYLSGRELGAGRELVGRLRERHGRPVVALQPFGSGARPDGDFADPTFRSLPARTAEQIIRALSPQVTFLNCCHVEIPIEGVYNYKLKTRELFGAVAACEAVLSVDSCLSHIGYSLGKPGVLLLGATSINNVGYPAHFTCITRPGYPRSHNPNRIFGYIDQNREALQFSDHETSQIIDTFKRDVLGRLK